jgi:flagellar biosynthetic protein FliQ
VSPVYEYALRVLREGLLLAVVVATPLLCASLIAGLVMGVVQSVTQVQDQTVGFVPKLAIAAVALAIAAPWIGGQLTKFLRAVLEGFPQVVH